MKRNLLGLFAVVLAVGASAFTVKTQQNTAAALYWYDAETLELINSVPTEQIPSNCRLTPARDCAYGFSQMPSQVDPNQAERTVFKP